MSENKILTKGEYVNMVGPTDLESHYIIPEFSDIPRDYKDFFENRLSSIYGETLEDTRCLYSTSENPSLTYITPDSIFHEIIDPTNKTKNYFFLDNIGGNIKLYLSYNNIGIQNKLYEKSSSFNFELHTWENGEDEIVGEWYWQASKATQDVTVIFEPTDSINFEWFFDKSYPQYIVIRDTWDLTDSFEISLGEHSDVELNFLMFTTEANHIDSNLKYYLRGKPNGEYIDDSPFFNIYSELEEIGAIIYDGEDVYLPVDSYDWGHSVSCPEYIVLDDLNGESYFGQHKFENQIEVQYSTSIMDTGVNEYGEGYIYYDIYTLQMDYPFINPCKVEYRVKVKTKIFLDDDSGYEYDESTTEDTVSIEAPGATYYEDTLIFSYGEYKVISLEIIDFNVTIENSAYSPLKYVKF